MLRMNNARPAQKCKASTPNGGRDGNGTPSFLVLHTE
jgi:hypothetical protein